MKALVLVLSTLFISACAWDPPSAPTGPVNTQVTLAPGETADVAAAGIRLRFETVVGDSRCPGDAICVSAGDATVRVAVLPTGGGQVAVDLHTDLRPPGRYNDLTLALENLSPYPFASRPTAPSDYRATIRVTR